MTLAKDFAALVERITPGPVVVYSEPEVNLPPSLFTGTPGQSGFAPIEPLRGYDLDFAALCFTHAREIAEALGEREADAWLVEWNIAGEDWVDVHADEVRAVDQARAKGGTCTPLYRPALAAIGAKP